ncbi:hypothetical protein E3P92_00875 [Wallemia ichthyophaga]|uniref:NADP-dependent oxidoreductase domain-containing protein n=1 Tax=Wallemia ichthyophaga TaxID=245174 RepID=A0A4T0I963_WALIC|nr:hypothetical protein E3P90_00748 [Wallemia ichthyophaga]TIB17656.1 hypothetical protein E3P93_00605 [Wallemia ichthyophaga]TIB17863.1 hypothetical protein E3P92_00875 [Wallemia ichthyophaga]TIB25153.1 hypothetical protein E3P89_00589 [Wallemia ichthyophaga]TIB26860.1 hypothetical protein E3P88_00617 [Wallemia ichthyophaga]
MNTERADTTESFKGHFNIPNKPQATSRGSKDDDWYPPAGSRAAKALEHLFDDADEFDEADWRNWVEEDKSANQLGNGQVINSIGLGLWKVDKNNTERVVSDALDLGYRHIDGAFAYGNSDKVGAALTKSRIDRKNLWLTTKNWNSFWDPSLVKASAEQELESFGTNYLDLLLLHWPVAFANPDKVLDKMPVKQEGKQLPVIDREAMEKLEQTWEAMEGLVKEGKVRSLGISNFSAGKTENLLKFAKEKPLVNQVEINLHCSQPDLVKFNEENGILTQAYSPLGSDTKQASYSKEPLIQELSKKANVSPTQLILAWHLKRGINPLPRSMNKEHLKENLDAVNVQLPQDVFDALQEESAKTPANRVVNPSKAWQTDIFSDENERGRATKLSVDVKGEKLVYGNGRSVVIRDLGNPSDSFIYQGHIHPITVARISPSGFYCASADTSGTVRVWDLVGEDHVLKTEIRATTGPIADLDWDGESQRIIAVGSGRESTGRAFLMDSGSSCGEISGHSKPANAVTMRSKRPFRALTASDDTTLVFYTGTPYKLNKTLKSHSKFVQDVRFSPDDKVCVSVGSDGAFVVYDGNTGDVIHEARSAHAGSVYGIAWESSSNRFATASADRTVKVWCAHTFKQLLSYEVGKDIGSQQVGIVWPSNADGKGNNVISIGVDGTLNVIDVDQEKQEKDDNHTSHTHIHGPTRAITAFAQSADKNLLTGSFDGNLRSFKGDTGECAAVRGSTGKCVTKLCTRGIVQDPAVDVGALMIGFDDNLRAINTNFTHTTPLNVPLTAFAKGLTANGTHALVTCVNGAIDVIAYAQALHSPAQENVKKTTNINYVPSAIALDGDLVAIGDETGRVHLVQFDKHTGKLGDEVRVVERGRTEITTISFSPDGKLIAVGENSGKIVVYTRDGELCTSAWAFHTARVTGVEWTSDSKVAMSTSLDTNVYLYSVHKPSRNLSLKNVAAGGVVGGVWTVDAQSIAVAGSDGNIRTFNVDLSILSD